MCGIVGYAGSRRATPILLEGLKRLEYRGYDSAGLAVGLGNGELAVVKKTGKIQALRLATPKELPGSWGIGHTRWATHGGVTDANAHPHLDSSGKIAVVHNGIVENYRALRGMLEREGVVFASETDSEVIPHLVAKCYRGDLEAAVKAALEHLEGTYGIAVIHADEPGRIVGARNGSPLVVGIGEGEMFLGSDVTAMIAHTKQVVYLNDGELVVLDAAGFRTTDRQDRPVDKKVDEVSWELGAIEKGDFACYMEKEIFEQPESIERALGGRLEPETAMAKLGGLNLDRRHLREIGRVRIIAAGTSWHAGLVGAQLLESLARIPAGAELARALRYPNPIGEQGRHWFA
ncbi:MAG: isomerizing glutamine--fructose-6-phosphate transaminase, partial [Spirochaetaceae bacterium]|nr:isomerizing glutamine--fructose-6-phosphate transaminase [Spirochaetaceae bacterium]